MSNSSAQYIFASRYGLYKDAAGKEEESRIEIKKKVCGFAQLGCVTILMMMKKVSIRLHRTAPLSPRLWLLTLLQENTANPDVIFIYKNT
jgi:hypothetical protein